MSHIALIKQSTFAIAAAFYMSAGAHAATAPSPVFFGPTAYLSSADIPVGFYEGGTPAFLDNLEDGALNGGLSAINGSVISKAQWGSLVDSVDADDGNIDGSGNNGRSWFGNNITFTFTGSSLPTAFGFVWTDGSRPITFSAHDGFGVLIGSNTYTGFQDGHIAGETAEDRFFGVQYAGGVKSISVFSGGAIELDHIQYGQMATAVPEPETYAMLLAGLGLMGAVARRKKIHAG